MTTCTSGQLPYGVSDGGGVDVLGASPAAACTAMADWYGSHGYGPAAVTSSDATTCNWYYNGGTPLTRSINTLCTPDSSTPPDSTSTVVTCAGSCTVTHVLKIDLPLANLSLVEGGQIAGAILAVWAVAFVFRMIAHTLNIDGKTSTSESES